MAFRNTGLAESTKLFKTETVQIVILYITKHNTTIYITILHIGKIPNGALRHEAGLHERMKSDKTIPSKMLMI